MELFFTPLDPNSLLYGAQMAGWRRHAHDWRFARGGARPHHRPHPGHAHFDRTCSSSVEDRAREQPPDQNSQLRVLNNSASAAISACSVSEPEFLAAWTTTCVELLALG
ncbi:MAG: hypothetical protein IPG43_18450 [Proteobacteria bacterium]|nr:hypothetical protein [Pseudomonadota bacterium]